MMPSDDSRGCFGVCVRVCVRACVCACVRACVRACVCACWYGHASMCAYADMHTRMCLQVYVSACERASMRWLCCMRLQLGHVRQRYCAPAAAASSHPACTYWAVWASMRSRLRHQPGRSSVEMEPSSHEQESWPSPPTLACIACMRASTCVPVSDACVWADHG